MKIVFLDIDGVLNDNASLAVGVHILPEKVLLVDDICEETGAKVVISSCWGKLFDFKEVCSALGWAGLKGRIIDLTPRHDDMDRGYEIQQWLKQHDTSTYVILDDSSDMLPEQKDMFVQTDYRIGLTIENVQKAKEILMAKEES